MPDPVVAQPPRVNPLLRIPAARRNPLLRIPAASMERRSLDLGTAVSQGFQDIGRMGAALPAVGEHLVGAAAEGLGLTVPEDATPVSTALGNMAKADALDAQSRQQGFAPPSIGTEVLEGATRSGVGMLPSIALTPAAGAGVSARGLNLLSSIPGGATTAANSVGADMNDPSMGFAQRLGRALLQAGIEVGGENLPMGKLGLGPEARLAEAIRGARLPGAVGDVAGRVIGSGLAESGQEFLTGGAQSIAGDLTDNEEQSWSEIGSNALVEAGKSALTSLPVSAGMSTATEGINAVRLQQERVQQQRQAIAQAMARAFDPSAAIVSSAATDAPGPTEVTPEVAAVAKQNPDLLDLISPSQIQDAITADQQQAADADPTTLEATAAGDAVAEALRSADEQAQADRPQPEVPAPVDVEAENAKRTLADQERVAAENQDRERRRLAFALREDLRLIGNQMGGHGYDSAGNLTFDEKAPNRAARMGEARAQAFVRDVLGDDMGARSGDDPTASRAVIERRMQAPVEGAKNTSPAPEPTADEIVAMPARQRLETFSALPQESRLRLQPEITRLLTEQRDGDRWRKLGLQPPKPGATRIEPVPRGTMPAALPPVMPPASAKTDTAIPASAPVIKPAKPPRAGAETAPAPTQTPTPSTAAPSAPAPVAKPAAPSKSLERVTRLSKAVLPASVKVEPQADHVRITYPGGASIQVREVDALALDPAAWFDSVAKVKGALSGAFSRAGFGTTAPTKAQWLKLPKARQQAVMAEAPPVAAITDVGGRRVGISREALVRLVQPDQRSDSTVASAIEEEDHHFLFSALLTDQERTIVRDELGKSNPALAKEDPASRAVMEAAYEHWDKWNRDRQRALSPKTAGVFQRLLRRIKELLGWIDRQPTVSGKDAAAIWSQLDQVRERGAVTPARITEEGDANAVLIPKDESLHGDDLRRHWGKATGERKPTTKPWSQLVKESDAKDRERGVVVPRDDAYALDMPPPPRQDNEDTKTADEQTTPDQPAQAINDILPGGERETFAQWQAEADAILGDERRVAELRQRAAADLGLTPGEQIALRRLVSEQLAEAATSGNRNRWQEAMETASLRKAAGARVAKELAARRLDLSTPEGRRELILNHTAEMGRRWQTAYNRATNKRDKAAAADRWAKQQERIHKVLKDRFGIDLSDPRLGEIFGDAYSVGQLMDSVSDVAGERLHFGRLVGYYVAGNLLGGAAFAANTTGYPLMMGLQAFKAVPQIITKALVRNAGGEQVMSWQAAAAAVRAGIGAMGRGLYNGATAFWTGRPQATKQVDPTGSSEDDASRMASPIKNPFARALVAPFLEANRFLDETAWTVAYNGALAAAAVERKQAGDGRSHREIIESPDQELIDRAVRFADWFTLRGTGNEGADAALSRLSSIREASPQWLENAVESVAPGAGRFAVNPLYFVMPFFRTIAVLTMEGAKLTVPPVMGAVAAKRGIDALRAEPKSEERQKALAGSLKALAYTLAGLSLMGLAHFKGEDDDAVKGSPTDGKTSGERSMRYAVEQPRTIDGVDYSRLDPVAMPLALHADFRDAMRALKDGKPAGKVLNDLGDKAFNAVIQRQFLTGIDNLFRPQYDEEGNPKGVPEKFAENVTSQLLPGRQWVSTHRKLTETERMERPRGEIERAYDGGKPTRNVFGETERTREDGAVPAIAGLFFPPRGKASEEAQGWQQKIYNLNAAIEKDGGKTWWPSTVSRSYTVGGETRRWSEEEYDRVREAAGRHWLELLREERATIDDPSLTPAQQLGVIQRLRDRATAWAKGEAREGQ